MEQLIYILMMGCISEVIPNPHTINYLTEEQKEVIYEYATEKCTERVNGYFIQQ